MYFGQSGYFLNKPHTQKNFVKFLFLYFNNISSCNLRPTLNIHYVMWLTVRKPLSRINDKLSFVWRAVRNEEIFAVLLYLVVYRCIAHSLLCYVGNWSFFLELEIGQRLRECAIALCNQVSPYLGAVAIRSVVVSCSVAVYYQAVTAWCLLYFVQV